MANAGAKALGAPQGVQDAASIAAEVVPVNQATGMISGTARAGRALLKGDGKGFDKVMQGCGEGDCGAVLQAGVKMVDIGMNTAFSQGSLGDRLESAFL